jgi:hypothetical protein
MPAEAEHTASADEAARVATPRQLSASAREMEQLAEATNDEEAV